MYSLLFALALAGFQTPSAPSATVQAAPGDASTAAPVTDPGDRMVCRREHVLGSNRRERVCMTARQRAQIEDRSREQLQRSGRGSDRNDLPNDRNSGL
ncbi:MAG: hypothetical protein Q8R45_12125 [Brevundimonas sp.]|uniref:hypothetical protein n=1 Tax=Brevundimonas sp. TaxID=1871086 RepID=UPI00271CA29A|nr:hypothetical protein [Brevundimonas sp.]MDO9588993.1 hypothetical protein [Brevundimonas sp.]MDP3368677.1 hypothetical protein [Brevundimonas sp.]MDP3657697.1 hypothetical protein [Brevundimonas sp.]MDZ4113116.1 hypothetical protein [Brevundimonas sp.]